MSFDPRAALNGALSLVAGQQESVVTPIYKQVAGEYPDPNLAFLEYVFLHDTDVYSGVKFLSNRAVGKGTHVECSAQAPNYIKTEAEGYLTDWLKYVKWGDRKSERGFGPLSKIITQELGYAGTSLLEMVDPENITALSSVQISSIWKWQRDYTGENTAIWQFPQINSRPLTPDRYITYKWNTVGRNPWGYGLAQSLVVPRVGPKGEFIPPVITSWWQMQDDARKRIHRFGTPRTIFGLPGVSLQESKEMAEVLKDPEADATFVANIPPTIAMDSPTGRGNFQPEFDLMRNRVDLGLNALLSVMLASDKKFAYNSARVGEDVSDIIVYDLQQTFKSITENELLYPVLEQAGFDANLLAPSLEFNVPDLIQEYAIADIDKAVTSGWITKLEARETARQVAKWPLSEGLPIELTLPPPMPLGGPMPGQEPQGLPEPEPKATESVFSERNLKKMQISVLEKLEAKLS